MSTTGDVHVGDVGTLYRGHIQDAGAEFNPTTATVKKLIFKTPSGLIVRNADVTTTGAGADQKWFLEYIVVAADVTAGLHKAKGNYSWQGYVEFADGQKYHTNIETYTVEKNLN